MSNARHEGPSEAHSDPREPWEDGRVSGQSDSGYCAWGLVRLIRCLRQR